MKDCCDYIENGYGMDDLPDDDAYQAPPPRRQRQRDVNTTGQPLADQWTYHGCVLGQTSPGIAPEE
jgi:hypothetical protein